MRILSVCLCLPAKFRQRVVLGAHVMRTYLLPKMQDFLVFHMFSAGGPCQSCRWLRSLCLGLATSWENGRTNIAKKCNPPEEIRFGTNSQPPSKKTSLPWPRKQVHQMFRSEPIVLYSKISSIQFERKSNIGQWYYQGAEGWFHRGGGLSLCRVLERKHMLGTSLEETNHFRKCKEVGHQGDDMRISWLIETQGDPTSFAASTNGYYLTLGRFSASNLTEMMMIRLTQLCLIAAIGLNTH